MAPHIHRLVVQHEQALTDLLRTIEVNPVPSVDVLIVYQVMRCVLDVSNESLQLLLSNLTYLL